ncbi:DUF87 domain-containing protein [uncultured Roseobacter sp.]|uniref:type IV secretory system conjugative DNA transfer family protein n=1 Tax=uncultured Roseobacter sp. TaxID=114847 RepID=UPI002620FBC6|nr:DUF87 domain-containing protein [uncultured Roseobacter sp.]
MSKKARDVHMQVIGLSRMGKSYFLEHMIRQDIAKGAGVCVIDPHGELYTNLVEWLAANDVHKKRRIHLIHPAQGKWSVGLNPLCRGDEPLETRVGAMLDACQKVWQDAESQGFKTLRKLLDMVFMTLAHHRLSLREARLLSTIENRAIRQELVEATGDPDLIAQWGQLDALKDNEQSQVMDAVNNRLWEMTRTPGVKSMIGQTEDVLDFKLCMERNHIVLVNLAHEGEIRPQVADILGSLLIADLHYRAQSRDIHEAKDNPFYCYIDECGRFINETIVAGLDETAKFGLHYVLSHQRLRQLGEPDSAIREGVIGGAQNKVVFLQEDPASASAMGEFLFEKEFNLERPKEILIKPTVVGYTREWLRREGHARATSQSEGTSSNLNDALAERLVEDGEDSAFITSSTSISAGESASWGVSEAYSSGTSETLVPIFEDLPGGTYSLDELKHEAKIKVRMLQARQAYAYTADDRKAVQFATPDVFPVHPTLEQIDSFFETVSSREPYTKLSTEVENEVAARATKLGYQGPGDLLGEGDGYD